jgi:FAD/FMN-containing dehydrogenase
MTKSATFSSRLWSSGLFLSLLLFGFGLRAGTVVTEITQLYPVTVEKVITPKAIEEIQKAVKDRKGPISIGGGRYSMGGQTATEEALQIDMRQFNQVVNIDMDKKQVTVQAGIRWRDLQEAIDPKNLSIKIMQTYSNFTVGGSLSVNVHGRYIGQGPLIRSVVGLKVVLADGTLVEVGPQNNADIFYGIIGGYGGLGVIVEATLQLVDNEKVERSVQLVKAKDYKQFFFSNIRDNPKVVFHNGDIYPPEFEEVSAVSWNRTDKPLTVFDRMIPRNQKYILEPNAINLMTAMPGGRKLRKVVDPLVYSKPMVTWRNHEASYDVASLEPNNRKNHTYVLQEYFVPVDRFDEFVPKMRDVFKKHDVEVFNVSIRHALPDTGSLLAWARQEVFAFVVYYRQGTTPKDRQEVAQWTREMISEVLTVDGTYYLPYQIHATDDQFQRAYPRFQEYFDLKAKLDPDYRFRNKLWDRYYHSVPPKIAHKITEIKEYNRREDQTFLGLPEWYIVFNGDEYAAFLKTNKPSGFPYWSSAKEFWNLKSQVEKIISGKYPSNWGYKVMLWVIGGSYSVELMIKGAYENTIGRLTEALMSEAGTEEDRMIQSFHQEYADYVHVYPWYEFSYLDRFKKFWSTTSLTGENFIRKWERKMIFSVEFLAKAAYGSLIKAGTKMSYEPEPTHIYGVMNDPDGVLNQYPEVKKIETDGNYALVHVPRYDLFRDLAGKWAGQNLRYLEVAGNRTIFLTLIATKGDSKFLTSGKIEGFSIVPTDSSKERLLVSMPISALMDVVGLAKSHQMFVEHVFDY